MNEEIEIISVDQPEWSVIGGGIHNTNIQQAGPENGHDLCYVMKSSGKKWSAA